MESFGPNQIVRRFKSSTKKPFIGVHFCYSKGFINCNVHIFDENVITTWALRTMCICLCVPVGYLTWIKISGIQYVF